MKKGRGCWQPRPPSPMELTLPQALAAALRVGASRRREYFIVAVLGVPFIERRLRQAQYLLALVVHQDLRVGLQGTARWRKRGLGTCSTTALQHVEPPVVIDQVVGALAGYVVL